MKTEVKDFTPDEAVVFGESLESSGDIDNAEQLYRSVLMVIPNHFQAMFRLGTLLSGKKKYYEALYRLDRACRINRKNELALSNRGMVLSVLGHHDEALIDYERALAIDRTNHVTLANMGVTLEHLERYTEALEVFDQSLALEPESAVTHHSRGVTLYRLGRIEEAIKACDETIRLMPDHHQAHYNRGLSKLFSGDLKGGFEDCEAALRDPTIRKPLFGPFKTPQWDGTDFTGKTLMLTGEQGIGDTFHFMRFVPHAMAYGGNVVLAVHELARPLYQAPEGLKILKHGETSPRFDLQCPLMSLPHRLGMTDPPPPPLPLDWYTHHDLIQKWSARMGGHSHLRVGLCWAGNPGHRHDKDRSIPLEKLAFITKAKGVQFYGLQKEIRPDDLKALKALPQIDNLGNEFTSFRDTAAAIANIDLMITVDTSVAHLAASLDTPTWVLLPAFGTDWRWQRERTDSPWYPSMRLFRQKERGNWDRVMQQVKHDIETLAGTERPVKVA